MTRFPRCCFCHFLHCHHGRLGVGKALYRAQNGRMLKYRPLSNATTRSQKRCAADLEHTCRSHQAGCAVVDQSSIYAGKCSCPRGISVRLARSVTAWVAVTSKVASHPVAAGTVAFQAMCYNRVGVRLPSTNCRPTTCWVSARLTRQKQAFSAYRFRLGRQRTLLLSRCGWGVPLGCV